MGIITAYRNRIGIKVYPPILFAEDDPSLFDSLYSSMDEHLKAKGITSWYSMQEALPIHPTGASEAGYIPHLGSVLYQKNLDIPQAESNSLPNAYANILRAGFKRAGLYREEAEPITSKQQDIWSLNWSLNSSYLFLQVYSYSKEKTLVEKLIKPVIGYKKPVLLGLPMIFGMNTLINRLKSLGFFFAGFSSIIPYERDLRLGGDILLMQNIADTEPFFTKTRANKMIESLAFVVREDYSSLRNGRKFPVNPTTAKP